ncbi:MAG: DUF86 domain-containing protein [Phototrophicaceae bacterium]
MSQETAYLNDILERIVRIQRFTLEGEAGFMASELIQDAVIRNCEVIGEIVKRLPPTLTDQHPEVVWRQFAGFRDILIHSYNRVRLDVVWQTVVQDIPKLRTAVETLLSHPTIE